jgi:hypothetical protein
MAADPVDDALVVAGRVAVADRGIGLGAQRSDTVGEITAQHREAEGTEMVDVTGGEHRVPPEDNCRDEMEDRPGRRSPAARRRLSGTASGVRSARSNRVHADRICLRPESRPAPASPVPSSAVRELRPPAGGHQLIAARFVPPGRR